MTMQEYLAQVAWPEVQPFFLGGGEAPEAQAAEGTPKDEEAAEDTLEAKEDLGTVGKRGCWLYSKCHYSATDLGSMAHTSTGLKSDRIPFNYLVFQTIFFI